MNGQNAIPVQALAKSTNLMKCANPNCFYLQHSDHSVSARFCCEKCEGRHMGHEWAKAGKSHYKNCEKVYAPDSQSLPWPPVTAQKEALPPARPTQKVEAPPPPPPPLGSEGRPAVRPSKAPHLQRQELADLAAKRRRLEALPVSF